MSEASVQRFTCDGCGRTTDCNVKQLKLPNGQNAKSPEGWLIVNLSASNEWRDNHVRIAGQAECGHACSIACAQKLSRTFSTNVEEHLR